VRSVRNDAQAVETRRGVKCVCLTFYKRRDAFLVLERVCFLNQVNLILENDEMLEFHDFHGRKVLRRLGLWARLVRSNEKECGIHDCRTIQHGSHQDIVPRAINEGDVADEFHSVPATWSFAWRIVLLV
jgi:hypothetical protein